MSTSKFLANRLNEYRGTMICGNNMGEVSIHVDSDGNATMASSFIISDAEGLSVDYVHGSFKIENNTLNEPKVVYSFGKPQSTGSYCPAQLNLEVSGSHTDDKISGRWSVIPLKESSFGKEKLPGRIAILAGTFVATKQ